MLRYLADSESPSLKKKLTHNFLEQNAPRTKDLVVGSFMARREVAVATDKALLHGRKPHRARGGAFSQGPQRSLRALPSQANRPLPITFDELHELASLLTL